MIVQENGEAIDSGRFSRSDRHQAGFPTDYLKYSIEPDPNFDSKGMKAAKKSWEEYKKEHKLSEDQIKEDLNRETDPIDHLGRCFQKQCPPTKRERQRKWELLNLENPLARFQMTDEDIQYINDHYLTSDEEDNSDSSRNISFSDEDEI